MSGATRLAQAQMLPNSKNRGEAIKSRRPFLLWLFGGLVFSICIVVIAGGQAPVWPVKSLVAVGYVAYLNAFVIYMLIAGRGSSRRMRPLRERAALVTLAVVFLAALEYSILTTLIPLPAVTLNMVWQAILVLYISVRYLVLPALEGQLYQHVAERTDVPETRPTP